MGMFMKLYLPRVVKFTVANQCKAANCSVSWLHHQHHADIVATIKVHPMQEVLCRLQSVSESNAE